MYFTFKKITKAKEMNELIEKYFEQNLTEAEKITFEELLVKDAAFKEEFDFYKELKNAVTVAERQKIKQEVQQFEKGSNERAFVLKKYFPYAAILLFMISFIVYFATNTPSSEGLYDSYYEAYPNTAVSNTRDNSNEQSNVQQAFVAYDLNDFDTANKLFDSALTTTKADYILFYKGISLMELNKHNDALKLFETTNWSKEYVEKSLWFQSLCYLKLNDKNKAKRTLEILVEKKSFKLTEAEELLAKL